MRNYISVTAFAVMLALASVMAPSAPVFAQTDQQPSATVPDAASSGTTTGSASMPMEGMEMGHGHMGMSGGRGHPGPHQGHPGSQKHPGPMMGDDGHEGTTHGCPPGQTGNPPDCE